MIRDIVNVLSIFWARNTARRLVGNILNVLMMYQLGFSRVHCPCPCNVFTMSWVRKLGFAPSVSLAPFHGQARNKNSLPDQPPLWLARQQSAWIRNVLEAIGLSLDKPLCIMSDSQSAIVLATRGEAQHKGSKHFNMKFHTT